MINTLTLLSDLLGHVIVMSKINRTLFMKSSTEGGRFKLRHSAYTTGLPETGAPLDHLFSVYQNQLEVVY